MGRKGVYSCKLEGSAMGTDFYITARSSKFPLDHAHSREEAAALLVRHRDRHPDAIVEPTDTRSEEHTSELQSLMRISYAVFCLKKKKAHIYKNDNPHI